MPHRCVDMETTIGGRIREQRKAKGLSVAELAEKAGLSESMIEKLEQGARGQRIPAATAFVIADLFGCNVRWLVTGDADGPADESDPGSDAADPSTPAAA